MMMFSFFAVLVLTAVYNFSSAEVGVDLSVRATRADWECLKYSKDVSFGLVRLYRSIGEIDENAAASLRDAHNAKIKNLHGYLFPCITTSNYSVTNNNTCKNAAAQLDDTVQYMNSNGIWFVGQSTLGTLRTDEPIYLHRLWLDIEDENPNKYFDSDSAVNQEFIAEIITEATNLNIKVGFYTTKTYWTQLMNDTKDYSEKTTLPDGQELYTYPIWYPRWDGENSMDFYEEEDLAFGGWNKVHVKQTGGDVAWCGLTQVDSDYLEVVSQPS